MKLVEVALQNFRGYADRTVLEVGDLTALVGKNDAGKSTFLEALNIVLGDGKIDGTDAHVHAAEGSDLYIECAFDDLPETLTLDSSSTTSLAQEYLLDEGGRLRLQWRYSIQVSDGTRKLGKERVFAYAMHPSDSDTSYLHSKKNADLKRLVQIKHIDGGCDLSNNASMRQALWRRARDAGSLNLQHTHIELSKEDGKAIFEQIERILPHYVLFRADRPSTDQDAEVQDPMKAAIRAALEEVREDLHLIKERVQEKALDVARRTLDGLREFDATLATSLKPDFAEPKFESAFKLTLLGDDGIAVNKRGSGVRRLVLFSFFRAEAERRLGHAPGRSLIYAIEEPETAQHPHLQKKVISALKKVSETDGRQVLFTTHSPGLAGLVPGQSLRLVTADGASRHVTFGESALTQAIAALGIVPDHRIRVLVCVEGPYDRAFLQAACRAYRKVDKALVCLETDPRVAFVLLGGSTLAEWVHRHLLKEYNTPEYHIYDRDVAKYKEFADAVNDRGGKHSARRTQKREMENYLHPQAIRRVIEGPAGGLAQFAFGDDDDVEQVIAQAMPDHLGNPRKRLERRALKHWLNHDVASEMTAAEFDERDGQSEIRKWLAEITRLAEAV